MEASVEEAAAAEAVVLLADHASFDLAALVNASRYVMDTRHRMAGPVVGYL